MVPGIGNTVNGARIWIHLGPLSFQPGEVAKLLLVVSFAGYLVVKRDALALAGRRVAMVDLPRGRDLGPILTMWLVSLGDPGVPARPRLVPAVLRPVPDHAVRRDRAGRLAGRRRRALRRSAPTSTTSRSATSASASTSGRTSGPTSAAAPTTSAGRSSRRCSGMAWGGLLGRGLGQGAPWRIPFAWSDFIFGSHRRGARPDRLDGDDPALRPDRRARAARRPDLPRRPRQAAGRPGSPALSRSRSSWSSAASPT